MKNLFYVALILVGTQLLSAKEDVNKLSAAVTVATQLAFNCSEGRI